MFQAPPLDVIAIQEVFFQQWFWHLYCLISDSQLTGLLCSLQMFTWEIRVACLILTKQISFE